MTLVPLAVPTDLRCPAWVRRGDDWHRCGLPVEVTISVDRELRAEVTCFGCHTADQLYDGLITDRDGQLVDVETWPDQSEAAG
jgi:hypothetical protein